MTNHWKLGLFVVTGVFAIVGTFFWLAAQRLNREVQPAVTYFDESVQGLEVGAPVKYRGVTIGNVRQITFAKENQRVVEVRSEIYTDVLDSLGISTPGALGGPKEGETDELRVQLSSTGITGVKFLLVDFFDTRTYPEPDLGVELPANYVHSVPSTLKSLEDGVIDIANRLPALFEGVNSLMTGIREALDQADVPGIAARAKSVMDHADGMLAEFDSRNLSVRGIEVLEELDATLTQMRQLVQDLGKGDSSVQSVLGEIQTAVADARLGETTAALREAADSLGVIADDSRDLPAEVRANLVSLREALSSFRALTDLIERDPGALLRGRSNEGSNPPGGP